MNAGFKEEVCQRLAMFSDLNYDNWGWTKLLNTQNNNYSWRSITPCPFLLRPFSYPAYPAHLLFFATYSTPLLATFTEFRLHAESTGKFISFQNPLPILSEWYAVMGERRWSIEDWEIKWDARNYKSRRLIDSSVIMQHIFDFDFSMFNSVVERYIRCPGLAYNTSWAFKASDILCC